KILRAINFGPEGDFEGIALYGKTAFVLRSDGIIFEVQNYRLPGETVLHQTGITAKDNEGLCYDVRHNRLLIACKSAVGKSKHDKKQRAVYAFDLSSKTTDPEPVYIVDGQALAAFTDRHPQLKAYKSLSKKNVRFPISEIAIHPLNNEIYMLSA